jgi:hypothetical protein
VLHDDESWGSGTTEYALDAIKAAATEELYESIVELDVPLPMIIRDDLIRGLHKLTVAPRGELKEKEGGYTLAGFSFTARELFAAIEKRTPGFRWTVKEEELLRTSPAALFARLWPDALSKVEAERDLGFVAEMSGVQSMVDDLMGAWERRLAAGGEL